MLQHSILDSAPTIVWRVRGLLDLDDKCSGDQVSRVRLLTDGSSCKDFSSSRTSCCIRDFVEGSVFNVAEAFQANRFCSLPARPTEKTMHSRCGRCRA
jgi:hypothetical protein